jgi:AcrR family transcriptional regulator
MTGPGATARRWGGMTGDERHERRREQLLEAGLEVFGVRGWAGTTVRDLSLGANLSQRYFYEVFDRREDCFLAVLDRVAEELEQVVVAAVAADGTPIDRARATLGAITDHFVADPRRLRVAFVESFATAEFRERRAALMTAFAALGARLMAALHPRPATADRAALERSAHILAGGIAEALVASMDGHQPFAPEVLVDQLAELHAAAARLA